MQEFSKEETLNWMSGVEKRMSSGAVALVTSDDKVVVVKAHYKKYWSFPGGVVDAGETPRVAAAREVDEEVGIVLDPGQLEYKFVVDRVSDIAQTYQFVFEATIDAAQFDHLRPAEDEIEEIAVVSRQQIQNNDRYYSQSARFWASGGSGYMEQQFGAGAQSDI